jgi:hypothetical protein
MSLDARISFHTGSRRRKPSTVSINSMSIITPPAPCRRGRLSRQKEKNAPLPLRYVFVSVPCSPPVRQIVALNLYLYCISFSPSLSTCQPSAFSYQLSAISLTTRQTKTQIKAFRCRLLFCCWLKADG